MQILPGDPAELGATPRDGGVNFALFSAHAEAVDLCLFVITSYSIHYTKLYDFFLFGLTASEVMERRKDPEHARHAILASQPLQDVLQMIAEGRFSPEEPERYHGLVHNMWHS